jgi:hypothetical protein
MPQRCLRRLSFRILPDNNELFFLSKQLYCVLVSDELLSVRRDFLPEQRELRHLSYRLHRMQRRCVHGLCGRLLRGHDVLQQLPEPVRDLFFGSCLPDLRGRILLHWYSVHKLSGQLLELLRRRL